MTLYSTIHTVTGRLVHWDPEEKSWHADMSEFGPYNDSVMLEKGTTGLFLGDGPGLHPLWNTPHVVLLVGERIISVPVTSIVRVLA